jgi:hypothetical protein
MHSLPPVQDRNAAAADVSRRQLQCENNAPTGLGGYFLRAIRMEYGLLA